MFNRIIFFIFIFISTSLFANLFQHKYLSTEQAFTFSYQIKSDRVIFDWQIAKDYYLYKKSIHIQNEYNHSIPVVFPTANQYDDPVWGEVEVFQKNLNLILPFSELTGTNITIEYQGCTEGFCYPPQVVTVPIALIDSQQDLNPTAPQNYAIHSPQTLPFSLFWFPLIGLGLAFSPCIFPMLPLISALIWGTINRPSALNAFILSFSYTQGMAITYTILGILVVAVGLPLQIAFQNLYVQLGIASMIVMLSLSMFGLYSFQLPISWQQKLNQFSQKQKSGSIIGVFMMGVIASIVGSPCTSAPLASILLYLSQTNDILLGGLSLYLLALGMGVPFILIALLGNKFLPKSGEWLLKIKILSGFIMLIFPITLIARVLPEHVEILLWSAWAVSFIFFLMSRFNQKKSTKIVMSILITATILLKFFGESSSDSWMLSNSNNKFIKIENQLQLEQYLTACEDKLIMLDFYAEWCVACTEFDKYTFSDNEVKKYLDNFIILRIDVTKNSDENTALLKKFNILGLPTIVFLDKNHNEIKPARIAGYLSAGDFIKWLAKFQLNSK